VGEREEFSEKERKGGRGGGENPRLHGYYTLGFHCKYFAEKEGGKEGVQGRKGEKGGGKEVPPLKYNSISLLIKLLNKINFQKVGGENGGGN